MRILSFEQSLAVETALTTGNFDGVHRGHISVLSQLSALARERNLASALVTFRSHPRTFFFPGENHQSLTTFEEKVARIGDLVDYVIACDFDEHFSQQSSEQFLRALRERFCMKHYLTGHDHHIGKNREGGYRHLESLSKREGFSISRIDPLDQDGITISTTAIKTHLEEGKVEAAALMLGYPYMLAGKISRGRRLGRTIGFPTVNIVPPDGKVFPSRGVYATVCTIRGQSYMSMTNIGHNPTIASNNPLTIETNIFDFDEDVYDMDASVHFVARIRDEVSFASIDDLKRQLRADLRSSLILLQAKSADLIHLLDLYRR